jgi:hypothetical protein
MPGYLPLFFLNVLINLVFAIYIRSKVGELSNTFKIIFINGQVPEFSPSLKILYYQVFSLIFMYFFFFFFPAPVCAITASGVPGGTFVSMNCLRTVCG